MKIDWHYHRSGCKTCQRMNTLLEQHDAVADEVVSANKVKFDEAEALEIAGQSEHVVIAKGKKVHEFAMDGSEDREALTKHLLGPSKTLRAPALRIGGTLYVGFHEEEFDRRFSEESNG